MLVKILNPPPEKISSHTLINVSPSFVINGYLQYIVFEPSSNA